MIIITAGHKKHIILIVGPPQNGLALLKSGLNFLCRGDGGGGPLSSAAAPGPGLINERLARAAGLSSERAGSLAPGWQKTEAAGRAKEDLKTYLSKIREGSAPLVFGDTLLCRVLPLWLEVLEELGLEPKIIHLTRHPWEVARALGRDEGLDLDSGHRLWLACHRAALRAALKHRAVLVAYEQLLEEPCQVFQRLGEALGLSYNYDLAKMFPLQLGHDLQAQKRDFDAGHMTAREKELYSVFYRLYNTAVVDKHRGGPFMISRDLRRALKGLSRSDLYPAHCARMDQFYHLAPENAHKGLLKGRTFWEAPINLVPGDHVSASIYAFGLIKPALTSFLVDYLKPGRTFIDVGAHLGYFSMLAAALVGAEGTVVSFEPAPAALEVLKENLRAYPQAGVVPKLAWHKEESVDFKVFDLARAAYNTAVLPGSSPQAEPGRDYALTRVQGVPLDAYCADSDLKPDLVNIDAEGAERQVLEGMAGLLETGRPVVAFEVEASGARGKRSTALSRDLLDFMQGYDYEALESVGYRLHLKMNYDHKAEYDNMILVPREKLPLVGFK